MFARMVARFKDPQALNYLNYWRHKISAWLAAAWLAAVGNLETVFFRMPENDISTLIVK